MALGGQRLGELKIIEVILERPVIKKFLKHTGLQAQTPLKAAARGPAPHLTD